MVGGGWWIVAMLCKVRYGMVSQKRKGLVYSGEYVCMYEL